MILKHAFYEDQCEYTTNFVPAKILKIIDLKPRKKVVIEGDTCIDMFLSISETLIYV
jgi:hypothetical protein